jgi:hypothetical protein
MSGSLGFNDVGDVRACVQTDNLGIGPPHQENGFDDLRDVV